MQCWGEIYECELQTAGHLNIRLRCNYCRIRSPEQSLRHPLLLEKVQGRYLVIVIVSFLAAVHLQQWP